MIIDAALREALSMAVEDSTGPWELLWDLDQRFPGTNRQLLESIGQTVLYALTLAGQIRVIRWNPATDEEEPLSSSLVFSALREPETWDPSGDSSKPHLRFYATPAGREAYFARAVHA